jgi:hypothetical protein
MVWQHLIPIIDKEKILWGRNKAPSRGTRMDKLTKQKLEGKNR